MWCALCGSSAGCVEVRLPHFCCSFRVRRGPVRRCAGGSGCRPTRRRLSRGGRSARAASSERLPRLVQVGVAEGLAREARARGLRGCLPLSPLGPCSLLALLPLSPLLLIHMLHPPPALAPCSLAAEVVAEGTAEEVARWALATSTRGSFGRPAAQVRRPGRSPACLLPLARPLACLPAPARLRCCTRLRRAHSPGFAASSLCRPPSAAGLLNAEECLSDAGGHRHLPE